MKIGVLKETVEFEKRVAATPETVKKLIASGAQVFLEASAGVGAHFSDTLYEEAGAKVLNSAKDVIDQADIIFKVAIPTDDEIDALKDGTFYFGLLQPLTNIDKVKKFASKKVTVFSLEMIPRIARAQKLDVLSSQSNVSGYKAVILAAERSPKFFPMLMTAAGTIQPAKVLILGAGVAGLQAIATAKRLGAVVEAFDTRPVVKEQVESLGGKFIEMPVEDVEDEGGYAKELSKESHDKELELIADHAKNSDIVITTALIPGKPAPVLLPEETVKQMKVGSVIIDLAAETGGNCPLSEKNQEVEKHGVNIIGYTNLPSMMASESSQLFARNVMNLFVDMIQDGKLEVDFEDEIIQGACMAHQGEIVHPALKETVKG